MPCNVQLKPACENLGMFKLRTCWLKFVIFMYHNYIRTCLFSQAYHQAGSYIEGYSQIMLIILTKKIDFEIANLDKENLFINF